MCILRYKTINVSFHILKSLPQKGKIFVGITLPITVLTLKESLINFETAV